MASEAWFLPRQGRGSVSRRQALEKLRDVLPYYVPLPRLSVVSALKLAKNYIRALNLVLEEDIDSEQYAAVLCEGIREPAAAFLRDSVCGPQAPPFPHFFKRPKKPYNPRPYWADSSPRPDRSPPTTPATRRLAKNLGVE